MSILSKHLHRPGIFWFLLFAVLFWGGMLYVFYPVLPLDWAMLSPDFPKFYAAWARTEYLESLLAGKDGVVPYTLINFAFPPLVRQELFFAATSFFAACSVFYYLRTQRLSLAASYGGGLFFAFSGYSFTLFCAGHGGYFMLISWGLFAFGLINRCFETGRLHYFALLGATLIWSEIHQPDVWLLFVFLIVAYAAWRSLREWRETRKISFLWRIYPRFILSLIVALLIGARQIKLALTDTLHAREKQFADASLVAPGDGSATANQADQEKKTSERWIFSTNWSLPPEDVLEFVVPGVFGNDSFQMPYPYWGRLGQPYAFQKGKMMPNYRQHTVYLGVISVLCMLFGCWCWLLSRRTAAPAALAAGGAREPCFSDVPFWIGAWCVCMVISLGRYTPAYQLVYHLPYMDYLRAPVKFHHLVEIANAFLAAFGIQYLLRPDLASGATRRKFAVLVAGVLACLLAGFAWVELNAATIERHIGELGLGQAATALREYAASNLLRSAFLAGLAVAGILWTGRRAASATALATVACLAVALGTVDLAAVARRHVVPINIGPHHAANVVVKTMLARTGGRPANVINYVTTGANEQDWFTMSLGLNGFANMVPGGESDPLADAMAKLQRAPEKYWQLAGVRFVLLPRRGVEPFVRQRVLSVLCDFEIGPGTVRRVSSSSSSLVLAEVVSGPPLPALYYAWDGPVAPGQQMAHVLAADGVGRPVANAAPPSSTETNRTAEAVQFDAMRRMPYALSTHGSITARAPGLLVFSELFGAEAEAFVDGMAAPVLKANGLWAAIEIPQGTHRVVLRQKRAWHLNALSLLTSLCVVGWAVARLRPAPNH